MLRLHTFGELSIWREGESAPIQSVQRRSLTLLAILASSRSSGVSRERVLGILWPESDDESAKASLRQAVFTARRELGSDDVILGSNELSLNSAVITSDVNQFASAVASKKYEQVVELYKGPFLDGVQARNSAEFERWAESQRSTFAGEYKHVLEELASIASARGESVKAADWWRKLATEDPLSSRYAGGLMEALIAAGDSGAALSHYRIHESLVREELSSAPDPAVSLIAKQARELGTAAARVPSNRRPGQVSFENAPDGGQHVTRTPLSELASVDSEAQRAEPTREAKANRGVKSRGRAMVAAAIVGASVLVALAFVARSRLEPESTKRVVIAPFENRTGDPQLDALGAMTADWITEDLSRTGLIGVIDPGTAFFAARDALERTGSVSGSSAAVKAISLATDADIVATGDYFRKGDSLEFHARVSDARNARVIGTIEPVVVGGRSPTDAVEAVRQRVLGILARELDPRLSDVIDEQSTPPTFDAYRAYTLGLQSFVRRDYDNAALKFRRAYEIDTSFAAALVWASSAYDYGEEKHDLARALLDTLLPKREGLTTLDRYALDAMRAYYAGRIDSSLSAAKAAAALAPRSQWVWNAARWSIEANRPHDAIVLLERLDPNRGWLKGWSNYWIRLSDAKHMVGDYRGEWESIERGLHVSLGDNPDLQMRRMRSLAAQGRNQEFDADINGLLASPDSNAANRIVYLLYELRIHGHKTHAEQLFRRALPYFESKWARTPHGGFDFGDLLFLSERCEEARRQFERGASDALRPTDSSRLLHHTGASVLGHIGTCSAALGDTAAAIAIAGSLSRFIGNRKPDAIYWEAIVLAKLRRRAEAVALLRQAYALGYPKAPFFGHSLRFRFPDLFGYPPFEEFFKPDS